MGRELHGGEQRYDPPIRRVTRDTLLSDSVSKHYQGDTTMTEDYQIDIEYVESQFNNELEGVKIHVTEREISDEPEYAIEAYNEDEHNQVWESYWYDKDEFEAYCAGMKNLGVLFRKAAKERDD